MRIKMLAFLIVFTINNAFCQEKWNVYNVKNSGLVGNVIRDIVEDKQGNKWISTDDGVSKFDGTNWTNYNTTNSGLISNLTGKIVIDNKGNKWIHSGNGICKFDDVTWTVYDKIDGVLGGDILGAFNIDKSGNLWVVSGNSANYTLGKYDGVKWTKYNATNSAFNALLCWDIEIDSLDNKWIGSDKGLFKFDSLNWVKYDTLNCLISNNFIKEIKIDKKGRKWLITYHDSQYDKLSVYNDTTWKNFDNSEIIKTSSNFNAIDVDQEANTWIATSNGVAKYDGKSWFKYGVNNSPLVDSSYNMISSLGVLNVFIDKNDVKWFGTKKGIFTLDTLLPSPPVCDSVFFVKMDKNDSVFCQGFVDLYISEENKMYGYQWSINKKNDSIYNGPFSVVNQYSFNNPLEKGKYEISVIGYDLKGCKSKPTNVIITVLPNPKVHINNIDSIIYKNANPILLKGLPAGGIFTGNGIIGDTLYPSKSNLGLMSITYQYKDSLKCSNTDVKVVSIIDTTKNINNVDFIHFDTSNSGLLNNTINDIAFDAQNTCWIATNNGVSTYDNKEWKNYTTSNSKLSNDIVKSIAIDTLGNKWICTNSKNIDEFKIDQLWNNYNVNILTNEVVVDNQNIKWFATNQGILEFNNSYNDSVWDLYNHQNINLSDSIINSLFSVNNGLVLGTKNNGVIVFNTYFKTPDYQYDTINSTISTNNINNVLVDKIGNIWAGTNIGLCKINLGLDINVNSIVENYTTKNSGLLSDTILSLSMDTSGLVYIGTKNGLTTFNGKQWETILSNKRGNTDYEIFSTAIDSEGNKWIGTKNGLYKIKNSSTASIKKEIIKENILVYPNPTKNSIFVSNIEPNTEIYILDINGRIIYQETAMNDKIEIKIRESIQRGIYFIQANQNGNLRHSSKIIVE